MCRVRGSRLQDVGIQTLAINGVGSTGGSTLTVGTGLTNAGVLELQTLVITGTTNSAQSNLVVTTGTLTNSGTLRTLNDAFSGTGRTTIA